MPTAETQLQTILSRRSANARMLIAPGPDEAALEAIVKAGAHAPDHGRLVPFRIIRIADAARPRFADILEAASRELSPDLAQPDIDRAREKADQGPLILGLIARIDAKHPKIPASDQWLTTGCVLENMLFAIQATGYAAAIRSGRFLETRAMRMGFALGEDEHLVSFLAIGTATDWPPQKPKPTHEQVYSVWNG
ncbi:NfnB Nitroreductase [Rhabdaerophilaceae bacterium]